MNEFSVTFISLFLINIIKVEKRKYFHLKYLTLI